MAKCSICGKSIKGVAKHKQRVHGIGGANTSVESSGGPESGPLTGEIGRIMQIAEDGEPVRAKHMMDLYLKGPNPINSEAIQVITDQGNLKVIGVQAIQPRRNY